MKPKLIAFPVDDIRCRVWCPFCARWHTHGYDDEERRCWTHRMAHCGNLAKTVFPQGYWIKLAPVKDRRAIGRDRVVLSGFPSIRRSAT